MKVKIMSQFVAKSVTKLFTQSLITFLVTIFLIIITFVTIVNSFPSLSGGPLYDHNSKEIRIYSDNNFSKNVFEDVANSGRIQLIQFYNSWCGHCIAFAPTFKQLAHQSRFWKQLMSISVVDCAQDTNTKLCRNMDINVYPTLKLFWFSPKDDQKGFEMTIDQRNVEGIQKAIITWIGDNWSKGVPRNWPDLMPVSAVSKDKFIKFLPIEKGIPIVLIVEKEKSFLGREIILDLSAYQSQVTVLRMLDTSQTLINQLLPHPLDTYKLPLMLTINNKDYTFKLLQMNVYSEDKLREMFTKVIKSEFIKTENEDENSLFGDEHNFQQIAPNRLPEESSISRESDVIERPSTGEQHIHMSDLNNALRYSLFQEIALKKKLNTTQVIALKNYLSVLELHFPFQTDKMRTFINYLSKWLSKKKATVDTEDMMTTMKIYEEYYHFPEMKPWKECAGSDTKYRGYPCSMWTLFHTLTVSEYKNTLKSKKWSTLHQVLYAMRDYIKDFFGCTYCAKHFQLMAADFESVLTYPNSSVLWLWRSHNRVNKRLKGDASEDPKHPKQPYPPKSQCSDCYETTDQTSDEPKFNEKKVFEFLLRHYSSDNFIKDESELKDEESNSEKSVKHLPKFRGEPNKMATSGKSDPGLNDQNTSIKAKWNYSLLNNMDYSLILFLYFSSAALILTLCIYLKIRVRKRGQKYGSLKSTSSYA